MEVDVLSGVTVNIFLPLRRSSGVSEWRPQWHLLIVPPAVLANERNMFNPAAPDEKTECFVGPFAPDLVEGA